MLNNPAWSFRQTGPVLATFLDRHPAVPRERRAPPRVLIERVAVWHGVDAPWCHGDVLLDLANRPRCDEITP